MATKYIDELHQVGFRIPYGQYRNLKDEVESLRLEDDTVRQEAVIGAALMAFANMRESEKFNWIDRFRRRLR